MSRWCDYLDALLRNQGQAGDKRELVARFYLPEEPRGVARGLWEWYHGGGEEAERRVAGNRSFGPGREEGQGIITHHEVGSNFLVHHFTPSDFTFLGPEYQSLEFEEREEETRVGSVERRSSSSKGGPGMASVDEFLSRVAAEMPKEEEEEEEEERSQQEETQPKRKSRKHRRGGSGSGGGGGSGGGSRSRSRSNSSSSNRRKRRRRQVVDHQLQATAAATSEEAPGARWHHLLPDPGQAARVRGRHRINFYFMNDPLFLPSGSPSKNLVSVSGFCRATHLLTQPISLA